MSTSFKTIKKNFYSRIQKQFSFRPFCAGKQIEFDGKPFEITEEKYLQILRNGDLKHSFKLSPPFKVSVFNTNTSGLIATALYRMSSRFGKDTLLEVWENAKKLAEFINETPPQKQFERIFKKRYAPHERFFELIDNGSKKLSPATEAIMYDLCDRKLNGIQTPSYQYRKCMLENYQKNNKLDKKEIEEIFIAADATPVREDCFKCHPLVKAVVFDLFDKSRLHLLEKVLEHFDELVFRYLEGVDVRINSAKPMTAEEKRTLEKFVFHCLEKSRIKNVVRLKWRLNKSLLGGFVILMGDKIIDLSFKNELGKSIEKCCKSPPF